MNIIRALLVVLGCLTLGEAAVWILGLKLPGSIVGMGLLFAALQAGWVKLSWVEDLDGTRRFVRQSRRPQRKPKVCVWQRRRG